MLPLNMSLICFLFPFFLYFIFVKITVFTGILLCDFRYFFLARTYIRTCAHKQTISSSVYKKRMKDMHGRVL